MAKLTPNFKRVGLYLYALMALLFFVAAITADLMGAEATVYILLFLGLVCEFFFWMRLSSRSNGDASAER